MDIRLKSLILTYRKNQNISIFYIFFLLKRFTKGVLNFDFVCSGICEVCKNQLEPVRITDSELDTLKTEFIKNVVNEANIHEKTTSEEWESFKQILIDNGPFDVVIDGLNICYNSDPNNDNPSPSAASLLNIVKQLNDEGKRILVIGKKHMTYWEKMRYMRQIVTVFLVDNKYAIFIHILRKNFFFLI